MPKKPTELFPRPTRSAVEQTLEGIIRKEIFRQGARLSDSGTTYDVAGGTLSAKQIAENAWVNHYNNYPLKAFTVVMNRMVWHELNERLKHLRGRMLDVPTSDGSALRRMVTLLAHPDTEPDRLEYYITAWRQLIWQVKRRLRNLPTTHDLMVVLQGKQGSGKSKAVEAFASVLSFGYMANADFSLFSDARRSSQFNMRYLICLDEMSKPGKVDMNKVKQIMTASVVQARVLYENGDQIYPRNASFIGTTNETLMDSIRDSSGMRRFVEIRCLDDRYTEAWGREFNAIDMAEVWACETGEEQSKAPMAAASVQEKASKYQDETRVQSDFDYFMEAYMEHTDNVDNQVKNSEAWGRYKEICAANGNKHMSVQLFKKQVERHFKAPILLHNAWIFTHCHLRPKDEKDPIEG